jgi:anti-repressor protein
MVERNAKGKEARLYFIEMERQAKNLAIQVPQSLPEALRLAAELAERTEKQEAVIKTLEPKAAFHDTVADAVDCHTVQEVAKMLNVGPNKFFDWLRANQILMTIGERRNIPYQEFIDRGYFRLIEKPWKDVHGEAHTHQRTYVTGKGFIWLEKKFRESQAA